MREWLLPSNRNKLLETIVNNKSIAGKLYLRQAHTNRRMNRQNHPNRYMMTIQILRIKAASNKRLFLRI